MINGLIGTFVLFLIMGLAFWLIGKLADLMIGLAVLASIIAIFIMGSTVNLGETLLISLVLGVLLPIITMPLWPISSTFGKNLIGYPSRSDFETIKDAFQGLSKAFSQSLEISKQDSLRITRIELKLGLEPLEKPNEERSSVDIAHQMIVDRLKELMDKERVQKVEQPKKAKFE